MPIIVMNMPIIVMKSWLSRAVRPKLGSLPFPEFHRGPLHFLLGGQNRILQNGRPSLVETLRRHQRFFHFISNDKERIIQGHDAQTTFERLRERNRSSAFTKSGSPGDGTTFASEHPERT